MPEKDLKATLNGKIYKIAHAEIHGVCDSPKEKTREITVSPRTKGLTRLVTYVHEAMHALQWDLTEDQVDRFSTDLSRMLWRLGYRRRGE